MLEKHFRALVSTAVILGGFIIYANTFDGEWVWDDASSILLHQHVQDPSKILQLFQEDQHAFGLGAGNFYRPLRSVSFMIDFLLSAQNGPEVTDLSPFVFHISNLLWHLAATLLLFALLNRLDVPRFVRALVPLLYLAHPLHTEAVAYISGRADMMSATFMFAGLIFALRGSILSIIATLVCFIAALLSKESSLIFPVLLALVLYLRPRPLQEDAPVPARKLAYLVPVLVATLVYIVLRSTVLHFADANAPAGSSFFARLVETAQAFSFYIKKLFVPTGLHMEQTLAGHGALSTLSGVLLLGIVLGALFASLRRRNYQLALPLAWFVASWLPISGIFPLNAPMAEHWMYVPMAGFWWALLVAVSMLLRSETALRAATVAFVALAIFFGIRTAQRNEDWHSNEAIFSATLRENPNTVRVHYNLAVSNEDILHNLPAARRHYEQALALYAQQKAPAAGNQRYLLPEEIEIHLSLGRVYLGLEQYQQALSHFGLVTEALAQQKDSQVQELALACMGVGRCLVALGDIASANDYFGRAAQLAPPLAAEAQAIMQGAPLLPSA